MKTLRFCFVILSLLASWCAPVRAAAPAHWVHARDYQIGEEGLRPAAASAPRKWLTASSMPKQTRELGSLAGGEQGQQVPARGHLADIVWLERTTWPAASASQARILYYSFNLGPWRKRLDSETTVLTRVFLTQPALAFTDKATQLRMAKWLAATSAFAQAVSEHKALLAETPGASESVLHQQILVLGEQGVARLEAQQQAASAAALQKQVQVQVHALSEMQALSERAEAAVKAAAFSGIDFTQRAQTYTAFKGLTLSGEQDASQNKNINFASRSSLYYGVQTLADFDNTSGGLWARIDRHFFKVPLIEPVTGWLDSLTTKDTDLALSKLPALEKNNTPVKVVIYRNNPYTALDAPAAMNFMTVVAVVAQVTGGGAAIFKPQLLNTLLTKVKTFSEKADDVLDGIALGYHVAKAAHGLVCPGQATGQGAVDAFCETAFFDDLDRIADLLAQLGGVMGTMDSALKQNDGETIDPASYCSGAVVKAFVDTFKKGGRKTRLAQNNPTRKLALCLFDELAAKPLVEGIKDKFPTVYKDLEKEGLDKKRILLTVDLFRKLGWTINAAGNIPDNLKLPALVAKLATKRFDIKDSFTAFASGLKTADNTVQFLVDVKSGQISADLLMAQMVHALLEHLAENGETLLEDAVYTAVKSVTPAKLVDIAFRLGNQGSALAWDWLTDPSLVVLNMKRLNPNRVQIAPGAPIPELRGLPWLKVPAADDLIISHTLKSKYPLGSGRLLPLSGDPAANALLVMSGFKASVENQSAFKKVDQTRVKTLLGGGNVSLLWHVYQFASSQDVAVLPVSQRKASTAFNNNHFGLAVQNGLFPRTGPIVGLDAQNPLQKAIFGTADLKNWKAIDFTEIYRDLFGGSDYPLTHDTSGIFSDYTHLEFAENAATPHHGERKRFSNTFNVYVLHKLNGFDSALKQDSRAWREQKNGQYTGLAEVHLHFKTGVSWNALAEKGLWAVWRYTRKQPDGKTVTLYTEPMSLGALGYASTEITLPLQVPARVSVGTGELLLFDDTLYGYLQQARHVSLANTLNKVIVFYDKGHYPLVRLRLKDLTLTSTPQLQPADRDGDGVADAVDAFPDDARYQYDSDGDGMADNWETQYGFKPLNASDAAQDPDGDGKTSLQEFTAGTDPTKKPEQPELPAATGRLNDTGITTCSDGGSNGRACPQSSYPGQDAEHGRDVTHHDDSDGHAGFSFTRLDASGNALPASAASGACVKDNVTGLIWEIKTDDDGLRDKDWSYSWYQPDATRNGGSAGYLDPYYGSNWCNGTLAHCNTQAYVDAVNAAGLCGAQDWRLPSRQELLSLASLDRYGPAIDTAYFPETRSTYYWSSSPVASNGGGAWIVAFYNGGYGWNGKSNNYALRLVRGGQ